MRFSKTFNYEQARIYIEDLYDTLIYNWPEYDLEVCDPNDEEKLKELGADLLLLLEEVYDIIDKMGKINKDSFGC